MSGMLRRLAAQAMGRAAPLRPIVRAPYAAPLGLVEEGGDGLAPVLGEGGDTFPLGRHSGESRNRVPSAEVRIPAFPGMTQADERQGVNRPVGSNQEKATVPADEPPSLNPLVQALDPIDIAQHADRSGANRGPESTQQGRAQAMAPLQTDTAVLAGATERSNRRDAIQMPMPVSTPDFACEPAPLLALSAPVPPPPAGSPFAVSPSRSASSPADSDATEVHVTIGRIEITAVHEAPSTKPSSPPKAKPMSLNEYLARRDGKRS